MKYTFNILGWCILTLIIGGIFGLFFNGLENLLDLGFENNPDLITFSVLTILILVAILKVKQIYIQVKTDEKAKAKMLDELKLIMIGCFGGLAIGIIFYLITKPF